MSVSTEAGWGYDWGTPWSGPGQTTSMAGVEDNAANATVSPEMTRVESYEWVVIPSIVLLALTIIGAMMILGSMAWLEYRGRPSTTRTRLVQALVVSDLVLGIVGLIGNAIEITPGQRLVAGTATCNGLGFVLIAVLWTEHVWTLCLALGTYLILCHPLHTLTMMLEKHWIWLWALVWLSAIVVAVITEVIYGFQPSGGLCYYPSSSGLYGELMQFIPRAVVFIGITLVYARLYVFLKRPDKIRSPYSNSPTGGSYDSSVPKRKLHGFLRKFSGGEKGSGSGNFNGHGTPPTGDEVVPSHAHGAEGITNEKQTSPSDQSPLSSPPVINGNGAPNSFGRTNRPEMHSNDPLFSATTFRPSSAPVSPAAEIPPWERMELPVFQIDGQRYGGPSGFGGGASPGNGGTSAAQQGMFGGWKGLTGKKRPSTANSSGSATPAFHAGSGSGSPGQHHGYRMGSISAAVNPYEGSTRSRQPSGDTTTTTGNGDSRRKMSSNATATTATTANTSTALLPTISRRPSAIPPETSPVLEQESEMDMFQEHDYAYDREREGARGMDEERRVSDLRVGSDGQLRTRREGEEEDEDEGGEMDLLRMLRQDPEPEGGTRSGEQDFELVPESMASYLNRKTALLMLWFPLGYILLFSVSLIRVVYDFAGGAPTVLRAMSRWFVFAQGVLDALIYGLVEWQ